MRKNIDLTGGFSSKPCIVFLDHNGNGKPGPCQVDVLWINRNFYEDSQ